MKNGHFLSQKEIFINVYYKAKKKINLFGVEFFVLLFDDTIMENF